MRIFPEFPGRTRTAEAAFRGDPNAAVCPAKFAEANAWQSVAVPGSTKHARDITLRLPPGFIDDLEDVPVVEEEQGEYWSHILGSWIVGKGTHDRPPWYLKSLSFWVGPDEGYPTNGYPGDARQEILRECQFEGPSGPAYMVSYLLSTAQEQRIYVGAYWQLPDTAWLRSLGSAPDVAGSEEIAEALRSVQFSVPWAR